MPNEDKEQQNSGENNVNVNRPSKRLWTESNYIDQPEGTYHFALNGQNGTADGNENILSNEHSNSKVLELDNIIGDCYVGNNTNIVFSVNNSTSEIGIFKSDIYTQLISFNLGFDVRNQIKTTLRVRNNKRVVYFIDGKNDGRFVDIDALYNHYTEAYQNWLNNGSIGIAPTKWNLESFNILPTYNILPEFTSVKVLNYGTILPGSYSFGIRLLDSDLNSTNFISTSNIVNIYNDNLDNAFENIHGSRNTNNDAQTYKRANKSIQLTFNNLDSSYAFYQIAIIQSVSSTGTILNVLVSQPIPIDTLIYTYTGNDSELGSIDISEIKINKLNIKKPKSIEQIENRLLLGNGEDVDYPWCTFQKYASQIKTDIDTIQTNLNNELDSTNTKNPISSFVVRGYMGGEVYCWGIVYIMPDLTESPVYHIPGPVSGDGTTKMKTYELEDGYSDIHNCSNSPYWGNDYQGNPLLGQKVRLSRIPFRSDLNLATQAIITNVGIGSAVNRIQHSVNIALIGVYPVQSGQFAIIKFNVRYKLVGIPSVFTQQVVLTHSLLSTDIMFYIDEGNMPLDTDFAVTTTNLDLAIFTPSFPSPTVISTRVIANPIASAMIGIKFKNIVQPTGTIGFYIVRANRKDADRLILDNGVIGPNSSYNGYHTFSRFYPQMYDIPAHKPGGNPYTQLQSMDTLTTWLFNPEYQFLNRQRQATSFRIEGEFYPIAMSYPYSPNNQIGYTAGYNRSVAMNPANKFGAYAANTQAGSVHQSSGGVNIDVLFSYKIGQFIYNNGTAATFLGGNLGSEYEIKNSTYLNAVDYRLVNSKIIYNSSCDNKMCILEPTSTSIIDTMLNFGSARTTLNQIDATVNPEESNFLNPNWFNLKYVALLSNIPNAYSDFLTRTYYKEHNNIIYFADVAASTSHSVSVFNGDSIVTPYTLTTSTYKDFLAHSTTDDDTWKIVAGVALLVGAVVVTVVTAGAGAGIIPLAISTLTGLAVSYGLSLIQSGIKMNNLRTMMITDYPAGLSDAISDIETRKIDGGANGYPVPANTDLYRWYADIANTIYIESSIHASLRTKITAAGTDFLQLPQGNSLAYPFETITTYLLEKITMMDVTTGSGRLYRGYPISEYYDVNLDFTRRNKEKDFFGLPINYDCCSSTVNQFPNRIWYSEQSFQEETIDNCRIFLPNNYRDIESEHGEVTDIFRRLDQLYVHTAEALWLLPKNLQERVTGQITSFIGTGDFFSVPPKLVVDDDLGTAGTQDKWATVKTKKGIFFANQLENKVYWLDESGLKVVSIIGNETWFKNNLTCSLSESYYAVFGVEFPNQANPANVNGVGLIATYDNYYNRILLTKRDYVLNSPYFFLPPSSLIDLNNAVIFNGTNFILTIIDRSGTTHISISPDDPIYFQNRSFTISFSVDDLAWISLHSYLPNYYIRNQNDFYAFKVGKGLYKHNIEGSFQTFFDTYYPFIVEYVSVSNPLTIRNQYTILLNTEARIYDATNKQFYPRPDLTFNEAIFYNTTESTGLLVLTNKDTPIVAPKRYMQQQVTDSVGVIKIAKKEKYWHINDIRNYVIANNVPLFSAKWSDISNYFYIDKVPNPAATSFLKNWYELESFKDRYMVIRLYLYNPTIPELNLSMQYSIEEETTSTR